MPEHFPYQTLVTEPAENSIDSVFKSFGPALLAAGAGVVILTTLAAIGYFVSQ